MNEDDEFFWVILVIAALLTFMLSIYFALD